MFISIEPHQHEKYRNLLSQMYQHRGEIFFHQREWDVDIDEHGYEIDKYDKLNPLYLMSINSFGTVLSSMRVMPTVGPTLLSDVFYELIPTQTVVRSSLIWEVTRMTLNPFIEQRYRRGVAMAMWEILFGANELALNSGIKQYVAVFDSPMERYYKLCGWQPEIIGRKNVRTNEDIMLGLWDVSNDISAKMLKRSQLSREAIIPRTLDRVAA